jgi:hypothetical protein
VPLASMIYTEPGGSGGAARKSQRSGPWDPILGRTRFTGPSGTPRANGTGDNHAENRWKLERGRSVSVGILPATKKLRRPSVVRERASISKQGSNLQPSPQLAAAYFVLVPCNAPASVISGRGPEPSFASFARRSQ